MCQSRLGEAHGKYSALETISNVSFYVAILYNRSTASERAFEIFETWVRYRESKTYEKWVCFDENWVLVVSVKRITHLTTC